MNDIRLTGTVELAAAADANAPKRFTMVAYTGGILQLGGRIVVDVAGMEAKPGLPILRSHDAERIVGHADGIDIDRRTGNITVRGALSGDPVEVDQITGPASRGYSWQASIGAAVGEVEYIERGQSVQVNGRKFEGPLQVVRKSQLREVSFVSIGADASTAVQVAAKGKSMDGFNAYVEGLGFDPAGMSDAQRDALRAGYDAQQQRAAVHASGNAREIAALVAKYSRDFPNREDEIRAAAADAIEAGWNADRLEAKIVMDAMRAAGPGANNIQRSRPTGAAIAQVAEASLLLAAGVSPQFVAKELGEKVVDAAMGRDYRGLGLHALCRMALQARGISTGPGRLTESHLHEALQIRASGPSTISVSTMLSNVANKSMLAAFMATPTTWGRFCRQSSVVDFKEATAFRLTEIGELEKIPGGGEVKHGSLTESTYERQADQYGKLIGLDRKDIVNDDLGALMTVPTLLARMSATTLERKVYETLLGNEGDFFGTANGNNLTGGGSALADAGLTDAYKAMLELEDSQGRPVLVVPQILLVCPKLWRAARTLTQSTGTNATTTANVPVPDGNPWAGMFEVVTSPYLGLSQGITNGSDTLWYLTTGANDFSIIDVCFLNGRSAPSVESFDMPVDRLGMTFRVVFDFGVSLHEPKGGIRNAGA